MSSRALGVWCMAFLAAASVGAEERPNFLFVLADDQAPETLAAYGNGVCRTPVLDGLAREGMVFHGAYHMGSYVGAVCLPSRTMIMTGRSLWQLPGAPGGEKGDEGQVAEQSLPAVFGRAGYVTMRTCKTGNSFEAANRLFQVRHDATRRGGGEEDGSAWHAGQALEFLDDWAGGKVGEGAPFFLFLGFSHPHDPRDGPDDLVASYGASNRDIPEEGAPNPDAPPLPLNYLPAHPFDHGHPRLRDEVAVPGVGRRRDEAVVRNELGREYGCIEAIDRELGRVLGRLDELGELDRTYVVYTADHGIAVGRHGLMGKQNLYEHSWRVPLLVRGPGVGAGAETGAMVYLLDLLPTFCELAGIEAPGGIEGRSFAGVLRGEREGHREVVYGAYAGGTRPGMRSVRKGKWKLIEYEVLEGAVRETQLFDLEANPLELLDEHHAEGVVAATGHRPGPVQRNLAGSPEHAAVRAELERLLAEEMERLGDPFPIAPQGTE